MNPAYTQIASDYCVYDPEFVDTVDASFFEAERWRQKGAITDTRNGRGQVHLLQAGNRRLALRHYRRGGLIGKIIYDRYLWTGLAQTRAWREWHLLSELSQAGFPVPRPVAARVNRSALWYRADLMTEFIPDIEPLAEVLMRSPLPRTEWQALGKTIARFHRAGIHHTDLNARNVLWRAPQTFFLLDFDAAQKNARASQLQSGIARLRRSLDKFSRHAPTFHFGEEDWQALLTAYQAN